MPYMNVRQLVNVLYRYWAIIPMSTPQLLDNNLDCYQKYA